MQGVCIEEDEKDPIDSIEDRYIQYMLISKTELIAIFLFKEV